jgi:hypothetical protein
MTNTAERKQALTGETWNMQSAVEDSKGVIIASCIIGGLGAALGAFALGVGVTYASALLIQYLGMNFINIAIGDVTQFLFTINFYWSAPTVFVVLPAAIALLLIAGGMTGISIWYNYYNPEYTEIPNTMIDVRETDLGDKYIKYNAAKVFGEEEKNADFNAYEGKEWAALYYTKDATAGNCLTPKFVHSDNNATIARRHQGISMFGETEAYNLNTHVYNDDAPGVFVTVRYSTTKKAAAELPSVVGSMFATGALYALTAIGGAGLGVGGTLLVIKAKKKNEEPSSEASE